MEIKVAAEDVRIVAPFFVDVSIARIARRGTDRGRIPLGVVYSLLNFC